MLQNKKIDKLKQMGKFNVLYETKILQLNDRTILIYRNSWQNVFSLALNKRTGVFQLLFLAPQTLSKIVQTEDR